jgi:hypothetical protein
MEVIRFVALVDSTTLDILFDELGGVDVVERSS